MEKPVSSAPVRAETAYEFSSDARSGVHLLPISDLVIGESPRLTGVDSAHVVRLAECGARMPPIVVHRQTMRVVDGMHRVRAATRNGRDSVEVVFFDGDNDEAFIYAVELNVKHGLPLSLSDRKAAARRILLANIELSDRVIASKTGLSDKTIAAIRRRSGSEIPQANTRRGRDGRIYPVDDAEGRRRAAKLIADRPDASLREIASAASVSPAVVSDIRKRILAGEDPTHGSRHRKREAANGICPPATAFKSASQSIMAREIRTGNRQQADKQTVLEQLASDPSVRHKEAGRELLRWLSRHAIGVDDLPESADAVPPHQTVFVAALARQAANAWIEFARRLEIIEGRVSVSLAKCGVS